MEQGFFLLENTTLLSWMEELAPAGAGGLCESVFLENSVLLYFVGAVSSEIFSPYVAEGSHSGLFLSYIVSRRLSQRVPVCPPVLEPPVGALSLLFLL